MQNLIEATRQYVYQELLNNKTFATCWKDWKKIIEKSYGSVSSASLSAIGDDLKFIFISSLHKPNETAWEYLVCWYMNKCSEGTSTIIFPYGRRTIPSSLYDTLTIRYDDGFCLPATHTLVAVTLPDDVQQEKVHSKSLTLKKALGNFDSYLIEHFEEAKLQAFKCSTKWNISVSKEALYFSTLYSGKYFPHGLEIGINGFSVHNAKVFSYSLVVVPTNNILRNGKLKYTSHSKEVLLTQHLTGKVYWGLITATGIAYSCYHHL